jgi:putative heme-binding domain-containing protein
MRQTTLLLPLIAAWPAFWLLAGDGLPREIGAPRKIGLERRVPWTTSRITGSLETPPPFRTERIFPELSFVEPVTIARLPGTDRIVVVELGGKVFSFPDDQSVRKADLAADLSDIAGHLRSFGLTFHPRFRENRLVFISYALKNGNPKGTHVSRFKVTDTNPPRIDLKSEEILIEWLSGGHNGGCLQFGKDGFLYISTGDGGEAFPPDGRDTGQDIGDLLGSILRIDVDRAEGKNPYAVPNDNPFVKFPGARPEVWAYGLRNPWKMAFEPKTGDLWAGDVGWEMWEYVFRIERGGNYGWSRFEGRQPVRPEMKPGPTPISPPVVDHPHTEARSVTGGRFYYGDRLKDLHGAYVYGDYVTGKLWALRHNGKELTWHKEIAASPLQIIDFGEGTGGDLYILEHGGTINRLIPNPTAKANPDFPRKLSATGLFASVKGHTPADGVLTYAINAEPWADHATAERLFAVVGTPQLAIIRKGNTQQGIIPGTWNYPDGTVLAKTVSLEMERGNPASRRRLETQMLHKSGLEWRPYNYIWNDEQTDAVLAGADAFDRTFTIKDAAEPGGQRRQTWHFASRTECLICHTSRSGTVLGFNYAQLNREHKYGDVSGHQLATLAHLGFFADPLPEPLPHIAQPFDEKESLSNRARAYLHANCGHCHRRGGGGTAVFELLYEPSLKKLLLVGTPPAQGHFGIPKAENVAAGDPYRSMLYYRMATMGRGRMPYAGSSLVDAKGLDLVHDWIKSLGAPPKTSSEPDIPSALVKLKSGSEVQETAAHLLKDTRGALALLHALDELPAPARKQIVAQAAAHADVPVRDLFERFLPEEKRIKRLGAVIKPADILALSGDRERGRQVFFQQAQCKSCHRIGKEGTEVGPDLSQIGKKLDRFKLLESLLEPSKSIDPAFVAYVLETKNGAVLTGMIMNRSASEIVLKDAQGKTAIVPVNTVEAMAAQAASLMPEQLLRDLTAREAADLLEYLLSLKE